MQEDRRCGRRTRRIGHFKHMRPVRPHPQRRRHNCNGQQGCRERKAVVEQSPSGEPEPGGRADAQGQDRDCQRARQATQNVALLAEHVGDHREGEHANGRARGRPRTGQGQVHDVEHQEPGNRAPQEHFPDEVVLEGRHRAAILRQGLAARASPGTMITVPRRSGDAGQTALACLCSPGAGACCPWDSALAEGAGFEPAGGC